MTDKVQVTTATDLRPRLIDLDDKIAAVAAGAAQIKVVEGSSYLSSVQDEFDQVAWGIRSDTLEEESVTQRRLDAKDAELETRLDALEESPAIDPEGLPEVVEDSSYLSSVQDEFGQVAWGIRSDNLEEDSVTKRRQDAALASLQTQIDEIEVGAGSSREYVPLRPPAAYGRLPGPVRLHMDGIIVDETLDLVWAIPRADPKLAVVYPVENTDPTPITAQYGYWDPADGVLKAFGSFPILWAPTVANLVEPTVTQWFIAAGDSTMDAQAGVLVEGSWWNEASRQLTGIGNTLVITAVNSAGATVTLPARPAGSLTKIKFFGTRGSGIVKHEGRNGWSMYEYNSRISSGSGEDLKTNPYYDPARPAGSRMNPAKYCMDNSLMADGALNANGVPMPNGVLTNFSNLNIVFAVGWNHVYGPTTDLAENARLARYEMEVGLDSCHETAPGAKCIVFGIGAPPKTIFKNLRLGSDLAGDGVSAGRFVSQRTVFEQATKMIGLAFQSACAARSSYATFVQTSHQICPETSYSRTTNEYSDWSLQVLDGASDHVHYAPPGYMEWADLLRNYIAHTYCQGS